MLPDVRKKINESKWKSLNARGIQRPISKEDNSSKARQAHVRVHGSIS